jgi:hypothetical protein
MKPFSCKYKRNRSVSQVLFSFLSGVENKGGFLRFGYAESTLHADCPAKLKTQTMTVLHETICPGCGLRMPARTTTTTSRGYYNVSDECWDLYTEVLGNEYSNAFLFGQVHQLTVDSYAVQHAGGPHPDKSLDVHLFGLYLGLQKGIRSPYIPPLLQRLVTAIQVWPHYEPPTERAALTVFDVAFCDSTEDHIRVVKNWAAAVWESWSKYHTEVAKLVSHSLKLE